MESEYKQIPVEQVRVGDKIIRGTGANYTCVASEAGCLDGWWCVSGAIGTIPCYTETWRVGEKIWAKQGLDNVAQV
jgi:hypothetical protein